MTILLWVDYPFKSVDIRTGLCILIEGVALNHFME